MESQVCDSLGGFVKHPMPDSQFSKEKNEKNQGNFGGRFDLRERVVYKPNTVRKTYIGTLLTRGDKYHKKIVRKKISINYTTLLISA